MPIRPENRGRYPADWDKISFRIRFARALGHCECLGECGTNHDGRCPARHNGTNPRTGAKIVLTTAHLDHTPENVDETNLRAYCQACHLAYDADEHKATAARTRAAQTATWNTPLPGLDTPPPKPVAAPLPARAPRQARFEPAVRGPISPALIDFGMTTHVAMMSNQASTEDDRERAAAYIASRARALGWTRQQHENTIAALFAPPRAVSAAERHLHPGLYREDPET